MSYFIARNSSENPSLRIAKAGWDTLACVLAVVASYAIRFSGQEIAVRMDMDFLLLIFLVGTQTIGFILLGLNSTMWRYVGSRTLFRLGAVTIAGLIATVVVAYVAGVPGLPRTIVALDGFLVMLLCGGLRVVAREIHVYRSVGKRTGTPEQRVLIYGAGNAGELMLRSIHKAADIHIHVVGFIDDDPAKHGLTIHGKRVLGSGAGLGQLAKRYDVSDVYISIPSLSGARFRQLLNSVRAQVGGSVKVRTLPGVNQLANGLVSIQQVRKVEIGDLLRRKPVQLDRSPVEAMLTGQEVMVVGGGGSIGQELCRQIARFSPGHLLIVDSCEYNTYRINEELQREFPNLALTSLVADAGQEPMMRRVFAEYRPDYIFHAAAYKHVPLMETNPWAAVVNNLNCTLTLAAMCEPFKVKQLVLISSDKAVRPSSVMGATKRICELIVSAHSKVGVTRFATVRFGNVLGSSGSVIPKFAEQIAQAGPVTVTHPEMTRYFMLIPEAAELVLQAAAMAQPGRTFVLDMGEPVRIVDLARSMIQLACPGEARDIEIKFTGLRPGEKLHESLYFEGDETATQVPNLLVLIERRAANLEYVASVRNFVSRACDMDKNELLLAIRSLAPEFTPQGLQVPPSDRITPVNPVHAAEAMTVAYHGS